MKTPSIEFPCDYPIKVIGEDSADFRTTVIEVVRRFDATLALDKIKERRSRHGAYVSITLLIWALGEQQLQNLFQELKKCKGIRLVL